MSAHTDRTDEELLDDVRRGDVDAYARLWRRHHDSALRAARCITRVAEPDDLVSEAFAAVFGAIRRGGGPREAFRPYLLQSIRNQAASWARRRAPLYIDDLVDTELPSDVDDPYADADTRSLLRGALAELPRRQREILWLIDVEGFKPGDVAALCGMTPNAVSALVYRARHALRQAWRDSDVAEPTLALAA